jgi:hypothetical protein
MLTSSIQILNKALTDIAYVQSLKGHLSTVVTKAYVESLHYTHGKFRKCALVEEKC